MVEELATVIEADKSAIDGDDVESTSAGAPDCLSIPDYALTSEAKPFAKWEDLSDSDKGILGDLGFMPHKEDGRIIKGDNCCQNAEAIQAAQTDPKLWCATVRKELDKHIAKLTQEEHSRDFWFIPRAYILAMPEDKMLPRHQELRQAGILVKRTVPWEHVVSGKLAEDTAAASHRWFCHLHPDPDCVKLKKLKDVLRKNPRIKFIWLDFMCLPQYHGGGRKVEEIAEFKVTLNAILPYIFLGATVIIFFETQYMGRFWPSVESWMATKNATKDGLVPSQATKEETLRRVIVAGVQSTAGEDDRSKKMIIDRWHGLNTRAAIEKLGNKDILVTNESDKTANLDVLKSLDNKVKEFIKKKGIKPVTSALASDPTTFVFVGNPGAGKSTIANCKAQELIFKAGVGIGTGVTELLQVEERNGTIYVDTPGLSDVSKRKKAAAEITKALRRGGPHCVVFVLRQESGRIITEDRVTMKLVLEACKEIGQQYAIVVNKCPNKLVNVATEDPAALAEFKQLLFDGLPQATNALFFAKKIKEIDDEEDMIVPLPKELDDFLNSAPIVNLTKGKAEEVNASSYEDMVDKLAEEKEKSAQEKAALMKKVKEAEEKAAAKVREEAAARKRAEEQAKKLAEEKEKVRAKGAREAEELRRQMAEAAQKDAAKTAAEKAAREKAEAQAKKLAAKKEEQDKAARAEAARRKGQELKFVEGKRCWFVDFIRFNYVNGSSAGYGNSTGGDWISDFYLNEDEHVIRIDGKQNGYSRNAAAKYLASEIVLTTNHRRTWKVDGKCPDPLGSSFSFAAPAGHGIIGLEQASSGRISGVKTAPY